jgi:hypothetical protein
MNTFEKVMWFFCASAVLSMMFGGAILSPLVIYGGLVLAILALTGLVLYSRENNSRDTVRDPWTLPRRDPLGGMPDGTLQSTNKRRMAEIKNGMDKDVFFGDSLVSTSGEANGWRRPCSRTSPVPILSHDSSVRPKLETKESLARVRQIPDLKRREPQRP